MRMSTSSLMLGQLLDGRYQITQTVLTSRFHRIYLAEDTLQPDRPPYVVKSFRPTDSDRNSLDRARSLFRTEIQRLKSLEAKTDRVPKLLAGFEQEGDFYIVEEAIAGSPIAEEMRDGTKHDEAYAIELLVDVLLTLQVVHQEGIVHGDINPSNLIRRECDGKLALVNFIALKGIGNPLWHDDTVPVMGTPSYMPAEQARGQLTPACDIYALGLTVVQALTGLHPSQLDYNSKTKTLVWQNKSGIRAELVEIFDQLVLPDPSLRYQSVEDVLSDLSVWSKSLSITQIRPKRLPFQRNPKAIASAGVLAVGAIALVTLSLGRYAPNLFLVSSPTPPAQPEVPPKATGSPKASPPAPLAEISTKIFTSQPPLPTTVGLQQRYVMTGHKGWVRAVAFFANGSLVSGGYDRTLRLWDLNSGKTFTTLSLHSGFASGINAIATSPDGFNFASASLDKSIKLWNFRSGQPTRTLTGHKDQVWSIAFSPDGNFLVSAGADKSVMLWNWQKQQALRTFKGHTGQVMAVLFSPDGKTLASGSRDNTVKLWNPRTGELVRTLTGHTGAVRALAFSPDGKLIASAGQDGTIVVWNAATGKREKTLSGHMGAVSAIAFSSDGKTLASGAYDNTVRLWESKTGKELQILRGHDAPVLAIAFSPKVKMLVSGSVDRTIRVWR